MSKKQEFIDFIENLLKDTTIPENISQYWEAFKGETEKEKPLFTDNGKLILKFLQEHTETVMWKARDIAEQMVSSSRTISGGMRKLVTDGYVEKIEGSPVVYSITEKGKNIEII